MSPDLASSCEEDVLVIIECCPRFIPTNILAWGRQNFLRKMQWVISQFLSLKRVNTITKRWKSCLLAHRNVYPGISLDRLL